MPLTFEPQPGAQYVQDYPALVERLNDLADSDGEAYLAEMNQFITCVLEDKKPPVGGLDGRISVAMGYAAMESLNTGTYVKIGS